MATIASSGWELEVGEPATGEELTALLAGRPLPPADDNPFFEPPFLPAAFERVGGGRVRVASLRETVGEDRQLRLHFPFTRERIGFAGTPVWRSWSHPLAPLGVPIVDGEEPAEAIGMLAQLLADWDAKDCAALVFADVPVESQFARHMQAAAARADLACVLCGRYERAQLLPDPTDGTPIGAKKGRELRRQLRKLARKGDLEFETVDRFDDVLVRFEEFLLIEVGGWKGRRGTSMHNLKRTAAFARQTVTDLAGVGRCQIHSLRFDGRAIAALIVFWSNGHAYPWKIAYDEAYRSFSPGVQLIHHVTGLLLADPRFEAADSLAAADSRLMNPLWPDRRQFAHVVVGLGADRADTANSIAVAIDRKTRLRAWAKRMLRRR